MRIAAIALNDVRTVTTECTGIAHPAEDRRLQYQPPTINLPAMLRIPWQAAINHSQ